MNNNNNLAIVILGLVLCAFSFGAGFVAGKHHERENRQYFNFRYDRNGLIIDGRETSKDGKIQVWPFVDVEYEK